MLVWSFPKTIANFEYRNKLLFHTTKYGRNPSYGMYVSKVNVVSRDLVSHESNSFSVSCFVVREGRAKNNSYLNSFSFFG